MSINHQDYANGIQKTLTRLLGKEPENKASIEWKNWRIGLSGCIQSFARELNTVFFLILRIPRNKV